MLRSECARHRAGGHSPAGSAHPTPLPRTPPTTKTGIKPPRPGLILSVSTFSRYRGSQSEFELTTDLVCNKTALKGSSRSWTLTATDGVMVVSLHQKQPKPHIKPLGAVCDVLESRTAQTFLMCSGDRSACPGMSLGGNEDGGMWER